MQRVLSSRLDKNSSNYRLLSRCIRELTSTPESIILSSATEGEGNLSTLVASRLKGTWETRGGSA